MGVKRKHIHECKLQVHTVWMSEGKGGHGQMRRSTGTGGKRV